MAITAEGEEREIVAGWYATEDGQTTSVAHWLEEDDFRKNGGVMNHETVESIQKRRKPFTVDYTGFGWVLIKKGVFENLEYPWFAPKMQVFESGNVQDMCGEDVSFCLDAKKRVMRSGVTLVSELVTKKLALFEVNYYGNYERRRVCARQTQKNSSRKLAKYTAMPRLLATKAKKAYRGQGK